MQIPIPVFLQRHRRHLNSILYVLALLVCCAILYNPDAIIRLFPGAGAPTEAADNSADQEVEDNLYAMLGTDFKPVEKPEAEKVVHLPFIPKKFHCDNLFSDAGHQFKYSEFYWEHSDAYKSALQMAGILNEGSVDELSWIFHEMGMMPFVETVCETGFRAGHYSFHWLTAKPEIVVYSFESETFNFTEDMATFMTAEFPDRFYFYPGKTHETLPTFKKQNNDTKCDLIYVDTMNKNREEVLEDVENFRLMKHPVQHMAIMLSYRAEGAVNTTDVWRNMIAEGDVVEQFSCKFPAPQAEEEGYPGMLGRKLEVDAVHVGTFVNKKKN